VDRGLITPVYVVEEKGERRCQKTEKHPFDGFVSLRGGGQPAVQCDSPVEVVRSLSSGSQIYSLNKPAPKNNFKLEGKILELHT
jgi:hypothetical protein